ncbi:XrtA system polysaccharide chain length determinant [Solimicrobium silvestre]|uniref:Polysaccharide chain length determinant protein, PEP-CTERM locus subfamily n=1 Tax=Solimicrobium silvestre TaxID=2099400 RepID=A0A2S9H0N9_9BURK|nr:XrtA system polysaccharide chain length determinant [Solimicrobium silvestre]PRC93528.1 Polysaccharide chain length determinant protein, PEP-CTERM locus subfamily [Solimicrobium silvestre]
MGDQVKQLQSLFRGGWKYRWYAVSIAWLISVIGFVVIYKLPDNYQSSARVFVDTQSILKPLLSGMTSVPNVEQQVSIMSRTLLSRPNIERVMRMVDLDLTTNNGKDREKLIDTLVSSIKISSTTQNDIYSITYNDESPKVAKDVVQSLLTIFVEGSLGDERQDSEKAILFIDNQIKIYEEKLAAAENALKEFKLKNIGLLPRQGTDSGSKLMDITENLNQSRLELAEAEQGRDAIKKQIASIELPPKTDETPVAVPNPEIDDRIQSVTKNLDSLRLQFTEEHPDIISSKRLLAQLQARKQEEAKMKKPEAANLSANPLFQQLKVSLAAAEAKVASMHARVEEYSSRSARLKALTVAGPEVESQLAQLNRDYLINKENYEKLVASRESAKISSDLSATTQMMTFRVIDPPTAPLSPVGPNRLKLFSIIFVAALILGVLGSVLMSKIRPTFLTQFDLVEATGLTILGSVSMNWTELEKVRRKRSMYAFVLSFFVLLVFYSAMMTTIYIST